MSLPRPGDVLHITRAASVQFTRPIMLRVIRVYDWTTYEGWVWIEGYQLDAGGHAVDRRQIFVQIAGLRRINNLSARPAGPTRHAPGRNEQPSGYGRPGRPEPRALRRSAGRRYP